MKKYPGYILTAALFVALLSSCVSEDESAEAIHQENIKTIQAFVEGTDIQYSRKADLGNGIVLLFTDENEDGAATEVGDSLMVNYTGYFLDGRVFDTSIE